VLVSFLPEAAEALDAIARFVDDRIGVPLD
jgi:hypothetical protein